jgi:hypothetical protein
MTTIPWKVGTTINEKLVLTDRSSGAGITGKVQADFTIKVSHTTTGNVSTAGITITEVSAVYNPGVYAVQISGSTGFQATVTGEYTVVIHLTSDELQKFVETFFITADGDFSGSTGAASFTAIANDGRVTDGATPLASATVRIRDTNNAIVTSFLTDASGLWGPVYLDPGTYTIDVQKTSYAASNTATILVVGTIASGPGADIAMASTSSGTGLTASDLWAYARRSARNKNGNQADVEIRQLVNDALDMVAQEYEWPFLLTDRGTLSLDAAYFTGTLTLTKDSTTCTLAGGTWPSWAALGKLKISGKIYFIASRTSDSVVVLSTAWKEASTSTATYKLFRDEYPLASDLMRFGIVTMGETWFWGADPIGFDMLVEMQNEWNRTDQYTSCFAIAGSKIHLWPAPSRDTLINYSYYRKPVALTSSTDEADWDTQHVLLLRKAIDYQCALRFEDCVAGDQGKTMEAYERALARAKPMNKTARHLPTIGRRVGRRFDPSTFVPGP